jgi:hypothetical protein
MRVRARCVGSRLIMLLVLRGGEMTWLAEFEGRMGIAGYEDMVADLASRTWVQNLLPEDRNLEG